MSGSLPRTRAAAMLRGRESTLSGFHLLEAGYHSGDSAFGGFFGVSRSRVGAARRISAFYPAGPAEAGIPLGRARGRSRARQAIAWQRGRGARVFRHCAPVGLPAGAGRPGKLPCGEHRTGMTEAAAVVRNVRRLIAQSSMQGLGLSTLTKPLMLASARPHRKTSCLPLLPHLRSALC